MNETRLILRPVKEMQSMIYHQAKVEKMCFLILDNFLSTNFREGGKLINSNWPTANGTVISSGSYDLSVELRDDDMGREGGGDEDQEAELEEGHEGREGGPGDSHGWDNDESSL